MHGCAVVSGGATAGFRYGPRMPFQAAVLWYGVCHIVVGVIIMDVMYALQNCPS
jgi:hypothetical protein